MDRIISGDRRGICFICWNCHFIFVLLSVGNRVSEVEYIKRM